MKTFTLFLIRSSDLDNLSLIDSSSRIVNRQMCGSYFRPNQYTSTMPLDFSDRPAAPTFH